MGNAPCSWGVEFARDPRNPAWETVLSDCAEAGYTGIELGPVGYMPEDPAVLGDALACHGLELAGGVSFALFMIPHSGMTCWTGRTVRARRWSHMGRSIWC